MRKLDRGRLTPDHWAKAALGAIARGGVDAVAVEPIAAELGATKGSFYWHFENRDALIEAALHEWEKRGVDAVIEELKREPGPAQRLKKLFATAFEMRATDRATEIAILANPDHPTARRAVRRVTRRRLAYMAEQFEELGWKSGDARDRAVLLSYLYVGSLQITHVIRDDTRRRHAELVFEILVDAEPPTRSVLRKPASDSSPLLRRGSRRQSKARRALRRRVPVE